MLGDKEYFYGMKRGVIQREIGIYNKIKEFEAWVQDVDNPKLVEWMNKMKEYGDIRIVNCNICNKEIRSEHRFKLKKYDQEGYFCSNICMMKLLMKFKNNK